MIYFKQWWTFASQRSVVTRACIYALIVGPILIGINHGDQILTGHLDGVIAFKMGLTMLVPYGVSTFSSVGAMRGPDR